MWRTRINWPLVDVKYSANIMGNVQQRGKADRLTKFQREKLKHEFYTFFGKTLAGFWSFS